jgi:hypothetical protein
LHLKHSPRHDRGANQPIAKAPYLTVNTQRKFKKSEKIHAAAWHFGHGGFAKTKLFIYIIKRARAKLSIPF